MSKQPWEGSQTGTSVLVEEGAETKLEPMYRVLLHNDDHNDMLHVIKALVQVFAINHEDAMKVMYEAHSTGVALVIVEQKSKAEDHCYQMLSFGLTVTMEPED